jgi:hypothetical protein
VADSREHGNECWGSIKSEYFLELSEYYLMKKGSASFTWLARILNDLDLLRELQFIS